MERPLADQPQDVCFLSCSSRNTDLSPLEFLRIPSLPAASANCAKSCQRGAADLVPTSQGLLLRSPARCSYPKSTWMHQIWQDRGEWLNRPQLLRGPLSFDYPAQDCDHAFSLGRCFLRGCSSVNRTWAAARARRKRSPVQGTTARLRGDSRMRKGFWRSSLSGAWPNTRASPLPKPNSLTYTYEATRRRQSHWQQLLD